MNGEPGKDGKGPKKKKDYQGWQAFMLVSQLGVTMAVCIIGGFLAGRGLDKWLGTGPWLLILLTLLGVAASFKVMYDYGTK